MRQTLAALKFLVVGPVLVVFLFLINLMTSPGNWWVQWPALGISIAWTLCFFRVLFAAIAVGGIAALISRLQDA